MFFYYCTLPREGRVKRFTQLFLWKTELQIHQFYPLGSIACIAMVRSNLSFKPLSFKPFWENLGVVFFFNFVPSIYSSHNTEQFHSLLRNHYLGSDL